MGEGKWRVTHEWPVPGIQQKRYFLDGDGSLSERSPSATGHDTYTVNFDASTGPANRWATQAGGPRIDYGDRTDADRKLLTYTGQVLSANMILTGQPVVSLRITSTHTDGNFIVYLEDVAPDGRTTYITEGHLRAIHRKVSNEKPPYKTTYPYHTFAKKDAMPLVPGHAVTLTFQLQATSVMFKGGHRVRIAIAGADKGTFLRIPQSQVPVVIDVARGGTEPSFIDLPIVPEAAYP
jgi:hypothetical protein